MTEKVTDIVDTNIISADKLLKMPQDAAEKLFNSHSVEKKAELVISSPFKDRMDIILMSDDSKALVQALPEEEVYWTIKERGRSDSLAIISRTTHAQFQYLIDVDCWNRDKIDFNNIAEWYILLGKCNETKVVEWFENADERFLVSTLKRFVGVFKLEEESDILEEYEDMPNDTFDNVYYFQFVDDDTKQVLMPLLGVLYRYDSSFFYSLINAILYEFTAESDEDAFRWRQVRMSEKGFPEIDEAIEVYRFVSDSQIESLKLKLNKKSEMKSENKSGLRYLLAIDHAPTFFSNAVKHISDADIRHDVQKNIINLANKIIMADCLEVKDLKDQKRSIEKVEAYINIGLEILSDEEISKASDVLMSVHPAELFGIGYSSGLKLKNRLNEYLKTHGDKFVSFAASPCSEVISGLLERRPQYFEGLGEKGLITYRDFKSIDEINKTEEAVLDHVFFCRLMFEFFKIDPEAYNNESMEADPGADIKAVSCMSLFNTMLVNNICNGVSLPDPLISEDVLKFMKTGFESSENTVLSIKKGVVDEAINWVKNCFELDAADLSSFKRLLDSTFSVLEDELNSLNLNEAIDSRYITALILK